MSTHWHDARVPSFPCRRLSSGPIPISLSVEVRPTGGKREEKQQRWYSRVGREKTQFADVHRLVLDLGEAVVPVPCTTREARQWRVGAHQEHTPFLSACRDLLAQFRWLESSSCQRLLAGYFFLNHMLNPTSSTYTTVTPSMSPLNRGRVLSLDPHPYVIWTSVLTTQPPQCRVLGE